MTSDEFLDTLGGREKVRIQANMIRKTTYGNMVTASKNYFIPLIKYCRNNCLYCGFSRKKETHESMWIKPSEYLDHIRRAKEAGCREILLVLGDKPELRSSAVVSFLERDGFQSNLDYVHWACTEAIKLGLEPHVNAGVLTQLEWAYLKPVMASAGLMLESNSERLAEQGNAHQFSPDKIPKRRIESIRAALEEEIPFTSGILIGIGETDAERLDTLYLLAEIAEEFDFLQELIIQGFHPLPNSPWKNKEKVEDQLILDTIAASRVIVPAEVNLQFPPNLGNFPIQNGIFVGANDLGGVSPITLDEVNFTNPWPKWEELQRVLEENNLILKERGPIYNKFKNLRN
ncbi:MAG: 7,8-didemethyl-8-hydroxy-5-deazariboflavin synthase CofG [Candidatus Heimdallarchaeota archaeon]|nr:7,8-didemethyl-8-hydroxy-5-deazariboflavin synthase CofG [Candidatus Heimdallarchaeota archaeon]